jgi:hypothetical protein
MAMIRFSVEMKPIRLMGVRMMTRWMVVPAMTACLVIAVQIVFWAVPAQIPCLVVAVLIQSWAIAAMTALTEAAKMIG